MLRLPAVAGRFYPANPNELASVVRRVSALRGDSATATSHAPGTDGEKISVAACLVPHAGYMYSGGVAGEVFGRIALPRKIVILGVRHFPRGESAAILSSGAWRTPLGDAPIDTEMAMALRDACPRLREDSVSVGEAVARVLTAAKEPVLLLATSDLNHYEDDATTRVKDAKAVEKS